MRLRTTIALGFAGLSVLQVALVAPLALRRLNATLAPAHAARMADAVKAAQAALKSEEEQVRRAMDELAASRDLEAVARDAHQDPTHPQLGGAARELMEARSLTLLSLFDRGGTTLSSGHLPARRGDPDGPLFALTRAHSTAPVAVPVDLRDEAGLRKWPALASARAVDYGETRLWAVGGRLLDDAAASHLAELTGAKVEIIIGEEVIAAAGEAAPPTEVRSLDVPPTARVRLHFSRAGLLAASDTVKVAFAGLFGIGLSFAIALGIFLAARLTRPVEALTEAATRLAGGSLDVRVEEKASGEVGELVRAFNRMTADLKTTTEQLVASERVAAWQEVARRLAHEIKNPLTPIQMSLETLLAANATRNPRFAALFQESAGAVLEEVERLRRIVDEFSRFARLPKPQLTELDLGELAGQVLSLYGQPGRLEVSADLAPGVRVLADRDQLTQVLVNLVKNAEEAMGGQGRVTVRVFARDRDAVLNAVLEVEDTGPGIPPEQRSRIFEPYFTNKQGGTGLGLAIAARISQEHGGRLEVGGGPGGGAVFTLLLPMSQAWAPGR